MLVSNIYLIASLEVSVSIFIESVTEALTVDDLRTAGINFIIAVSENVDLADANNVLGFLNENTHVADINSVKADYILSVFENVGLLDTICYNGWFKINTNQNGAWNNITTTNSPNWSTISTNTIEQDSSWINDSLTVVTWINSFGETIMKNNII